MKIVWNHQEQLLFSLIRYSFKFCGRIWKWWKDSSILKKQFLGWSQYHFKMPRDKVLQRCFFIKPHSGNFSGLARSPGVHRAEVAGMWAGCHPKDPLANRLGHISWATHGYHPQKPLQDSSASAREGAGFWCVRLFWFWPETWGWTLICRVKHS